MKEKLNIQRLDKPIAFIHIPKTAGTSFTNYFCYNISPETIVAYQKDFSVIDFNDQKTKLFWGHFLYSEIVEKLSNAYLITFLRDPLQRVISQYKSWQKEINLNDWYSLLDPEEIKTHQMVHNMTLEEFVMSERTGIVNQIRDVQTRFLCDQPDAPDMLQSAKRNLHDKIDFFGITDRFEDSINLFRYFFENSAPYELDARFENRSTTKNCVLTKKALKRIYELNQNDFQLLKYANKLFSKRIKRSTIYKSNALEKIKAVCYQLIFKNRE